MKKIVYSIVVIFLTTMGIRAQGTLSGTILDGDFGESLIGANVIVEGSATGASTDLDGKYQFKLQEGTYNIVISYIGYADKKIEGVEVKDGEVSYLDVTMSAEGVDIGVEVVVEAKAIERSENAMLMLQKKSDKIMDGISAQEMSSYSLSNVANAMQKVSGATVSGGNNINIRGLGDRYTSAQLNGLPLPSTDPYRNTPQLDLIPTNLLDNIITSKSFTPDLPANFTGGNIDIKTKTLPEQFFLSLNTKIGYNTQSNLISNFLTYPLSKNTYAGFFPEGDGVPDFIRNKDFEDTYLIQNANITARGSDEFADNVDKAIKSIDKTFDPNLKDSPLNHQYGLTFGNQYEVGASALGVIASVGMKKNYQHTPDRARKNWILRSEILENRGDLVETSSSEKANLNGLLGLSFKINNQNTVLFNSIYNHEGTQTGRLLTGERPDQIVDEVVYQGRGLEYMEREMFTNQLMGRHVINILNNAQLNWNVAKISSSQDEPFTRYFSNAYNTETDFHFIPANSVEEPSYYLRFLEDDQTVGKVDLEIPMGEKDFKLKFGGMYSQKNRDFSEIQYVIFSTNNTQRFGGEIGDYFGDENVGWINKNDPNSTRNDIANYLSKFSDDGNLYEGSEKITAVYGMFSTSVTEKLKLIGGLRVEQTDIEVLGLDERDDIEDRLGKIDEVDLFPVMNAILALKENINLRGAYSRTVARPNMREIVPFFTYDPLADLFLIGNVDLERTLIDNYDLRLEYFMNPGEIVSLSGYYKYFDKPIQQKFLPSANKQLQFGNVPSAKVYGIELEFRKNLGFISPSLEDFKFNSNFSLIKSETDVDSLSSFSAESRPFEGQPNFILNAALLYQNPEIADVTLSFNYVGERLIFLGDGGNPDIFQDKTPTLDLNIQKNIGNIGLSFSVGNILDPEIKLSSEYFGTEYIDNVYKKGVNFDLGLSYTIR